MEKVRYFIEFISRSTFLQDVALEQKTWLSSDERIPIPAVVCTMTATGIIYLYQEECRNVRIEPLKERTCFRLLKICSASKQKSLQGLDDTSTAGEEAFETIASIVENLGRHGAGETWSRATLRSLSAGKKEGMQESSRTGRALRWSLHCFCTLGSSRREIIIRGVCWASRWGGWTRD